MAGRGAHRSSTRLLCVSLLLVGLTTACGGGGSDTDESSGRRPRTVLQKVLDGVGPNGEVSKQTALELFSVMVGPLPGVDVPHGRRDTIFSGTPALVWIQHYWDELTPQQQQRARELVPDIAPPESASTVAALRAPPRAAALLDGPGTEPYRPIVDKAVADISARIPAAPLISPPELTLSSVDTPMFMGTAPLFGTGTCLITFYPGGQAFQGKKLRAAITHEVFHCFQLYIYLTAGLSYDIIPGWITEGSANWVMETIMKEETGSASGLNDDWWDDYLSTPEQGLYSRWYDAMGFFGHLDHVGVDVWSLLLPMLHSQDNATAFSIAVGNGPATTTDWPSGYFRGAVPGKPWNTDGPGITNTKPPIPTLSLPNDGHQAEVVGPVSNNERIIDIQSDFVLIDIVGDGHLRDAADDDVVIRASHGGVFCALTAEECVCPPGTANEGQQLGDGKIAKGEARLAVTGSLQGGSWDLTGQTKAEVASTLCDQCTVGAFVSTAFSIDLPAGASLSGGVGATLEIGADSKFKLDYNPMSALTFNVAGFQGSATITGTGEGTMSFSKQQSAQSGDAIVETGTLTGGGSSDGTIHTAAATVPVGSGTFSGPYSCVQEEGGATTLKFDLYGGHWTWQRQ